MTNTIILLIKLIINSSLHCILFLCFNQQIMMIDIRIRPKNDLPWGLNPWVMKLLLISPGYDCSLLIIHIGRVTNTYQEFQLLGVTNSNCQICVTSKASSRRGEVRVEGREGGVRLLRPTTAVIPMFSNLNHSAAQIFGFYLARSLKLRQKSISWPFIR